MIDRVTKTIKYLKLIGIAKLKLTQEILLKDFAKV